MTPAEHDMLVALVTIAVINVARDGIVAWMRMKRGG